MQPYQLTFAGPRDHRFHLQNLIAKSLAISAPLQRHLTPCRVSIGRYQFSIELFEFAGLNEGQFLIIVAYDDQDFATRSTTRDEYNNIEKDSGVLCWSADPWGDANAIDAMSRYIFGIDSRTIGVSSDDA
jgi:hypothetical protein